MDGDGGRWLVTCDADFGCFRGGGGDGDGVE